MNDPSVHFTRYDPETGEITAAGVAARSQVVDLYGPFVLEAHSIPGYHRVDITQQPPAIITNPEFDDRFRSS